MYTSPRTSSTVGALLRQPLRACASIVRTLAVTSSPTRPSPRVAACTQTPVLVAQRHREAVDLQLADEADRLGSGSRAALEPLAPRDAARRRRTRCRATSSARGARPARTSPTARAPTVWVGESGVMSSGNSSSSPRSSRTDRVVVGVADLGRVELVVALVVVADLLSQLVDPGGDLVGDGHPPRLSRPPPDRSESRKRGWSGAEGELRGDRLVEHAVGEILRETQHPIRLLDRVR